MIPSASTTPASRTAFKISAEDMASGFGWGCNSTHLSPPSEVMAITFIACPVDGFIAVVILVTSPDTVACIGTESNSSESVIFWPVSTLSPFFTRVSLDAPAFSSSGIVTISGSGASSIGL